MQQILLMGAGGHAVSCIDVVEQEGTYQVAGLVALPAEKGKRVLGYEVIASEEDLEVLRGRFTYALVAVGQIVTPEPRMRLFDRLQALGFTLPAIVSPRAYVSGHAIIGTGTIVMHGAIINAGAVVGQNCIINSQSLIEHDAVVGDHCHISTASAINGGAQIGSETFIGSGSCVREAIKIGSGCIIGMGQQVLYHCEPGTRLTSPRGAA